MALGRKLSGELRTKRGGGGVGGGGGVMIEEEELGLGFASTARYPKRLGKKRIVISNDLKKTLPHHLDSDSAEKSPLKRQCSRREMDFIGSDVSVLENLPQDILIKVICGVNHDDLKQLIRVSKTIREAASIAKKRHFAFNTPLKTSVFPKWIDFANPSKFEEKEAPNAPLRNNSFRSRLSNKKLSDIAVALFSSPDEEDQWPKKGLLFDTEI